LLAFDRIPGEFEAFLARFPRGTAGIGYTRS
jgi:hypothetical protein